MTRREGLGGQQTVSLVNLLAVGPVKSPELSRILLERSPLAAALDRNPSFGNEELP